MSIIEKSVLKTIVYYDSLDYPLTVEELELFSFRDSKDREVGNLIETVKGFYFLKDRENLVELREKRNEIAKKKWQKTLKAVKWLQSVPYIRLAFASGSLALNNTTKESDLDILIVAKAGRIWTARALAVALLNFLGLLRRRDQAVAPDKVCLNHFITDKSLYIPRKSIYTAQLYARLVPIMGGDELVDNFCEANEWVGDYVRGWPGCIKNPNDKIQMTNKFQIPNSIFLNLIKRAGEKILNSKFGDWVEGVLRKYQLRRIKSYHLTYKPGGRVKADDESLEFHPDSPELKIIERYNQTMIKLGFPELANEIDSGLTKT